ALFFFSSRRRHTRFSRDWSSDVCSSDLAVFAHRVEGGEREHLKAARVGENGSVPLHELVQPAHVANEFVAGPEVQVVGVGEDHGCARRAELPRVQRLYCCERSHGHERWYFHAAVRCVEDCGASTALACLKLEVKAGCVWRIHGVGRVRRSLTSRRCRLVRFAAGTGTCSLLELTHGRRLSFALAGRVQLKLASTRAAPAEGTGVSSANVSWAVIAPIMLSADSLPVPDSSSDSCTSPLSPTTTRAITLSAPPRA